MSYYEDWYSTALGEVHRYVCVCVCVCGHVWVNMCIKHSFIPCCTTINKNQLFLSVFTFSNTNITVQ